MTRDVWHDALRPDVAGIAVDALLFHEAGSRLVHRYRVYKDPFPHPALCDGVIPRLLSGVGRAMAIARLTHLRISIPSSGAPAEQVPMECFPLATAPVSQARRRRVSFANEVTTLNEEEINTLNADESPDVAPVSPPLIGHFGRNGRAGGRLHSTVRRSRYRRWVTLTCPCRRWTIVLCQNWCGCLLFLNQQYGQWIEKLQYLGGGWPGRVRSLKKGRQSLSIRWGLVVPSRTPHTVLWTMRSRRGEYGLLLNHPRFVEWIGVPQSAGVLELSGRQWVDKLLRDQAITAAVHLQRDVGLICKRMSMSLTSMRSPSRRRRP